MNLAKFLVSVLLALNLANQAQAQNEMDIKVKKSTPITREFIYKNRPVSPMALMDMFPTSEGGLNMDTIDLRKFSSDKVTKLDTMSYSWRKPYQKDRSYITLMQYDSTNRTYKPDSIDYYAIRPFACYTVIANSPSGKFVVMADFKSINNITNLFSPPFIFVFDIQGSTLIKLGEFAESYNNQGLPVEIKGNTIINGSTRYEIPFAAR